MFESGKGCRCLSAWLKSDINHGEFWPSKCLASVASDVCPRWRDFITNSLKSLLAVWNLVVCQALIISSIYAFAKYEVAIVECR
jgi:hypothetical protein